MNIVPPGFLISAAAVKDVLEEARRDPENHGEPMETGREERGQAGSGKLVGAGEYQSRPIGTICRGRSELAGTNADMGMNGRPSRRILFVFSRLRLE